MRRRGGAVAVAGLLVNISATIQYALYDETQNHPVGPFLEAGHYVVR